MSLPPEIFDIIMLYKTKPLRLGVTGKSITLPLPSRQFYVDWGDGVTNKENTHEYPLLEDHIISIFGITEFNSGHELGNNIYRVFEYGNTLEKIEISGGNRYIERPKDKKVDSKYPTFTFWDILEYQKKYKVRYSEDDDSWRHSKD